LLQNLTRAMNPRVFLTSAFIILAFVLLSGVFPQAISNSFKTLHSLIINNVGWFYALAVGLYLIFVLFLAMSKYGDIKLGLDHSEPEFSYISWFAMLFSAGMGIGLMFFGVAEPVMHFSSPPSGTEQSIEAIKEAMNITFFHYGIHAWSIYAIVALILAYFSFRHSLPLTIRSSLYPIIGDRIYGKIGDAVDIFAIISTMFGVATSLGFGVKQINTGLNYLFGIPNTTTMNIVIIGFITLIATFSVVLGLDKGIKKLSMLNMILAVTLLTFVFILGDTSFLIQAFIQNTGNYINSIVETTFNLYAHEDSSWISSWSLFYWAWWIAWSPFVGMFIARISKGRTIREFVFSVLFVPVGFTFLWLTFFGDSAIALIVKDNLVTLQSSILDDSTIVLFKFLEQFPLSGLTSFISILLVVTFFVTSSDSGSLVIDMIASGGKKEPPTWQRVFWAVLEGAVASTLLLIGGLKAIQVASISTALPFSIIIFIGIYGLFKALRVDKQKQDSLQNLYLHSEQPKISWQKRLKNIISYPSKSKAVEFFDKNLKQSLESVKDEFIKQSIEADLKVERNSIKLNIHKSDEMDFIYEVRLREYKTPTISAIESDDDIYFKAEVFLKDGSQNYDIFNFSKDEIISDILAQYQRYTHFLEKIQ